MEPNTEQLQKAKSASAKHKRPVSDKDKEIESLLSSHKTRIKVVGCGGAGNNTLSRLVEAGVQGVTAVAVNTDAQDLLYAHSDDKILIGREITNGLGAGSNPEIGEKSARESQDQLKAHLENSDMVFVTCGLGGGTGTGSAPIIAEIARELGALTIAVVTLPFTEEGVMRWENARDGLEKLRANSDTVIVVQNDKLLEIAPDMPLNQAFKVADEILANAVKGITELVTEKGLVNLDFADVRAVMKNGGTAMIGLGESEAEDKALEAVDMAVQNPLLDVDITGAKSALIHITGGEDMSLKDARIIMKAVAEKLDPAARVIWGARMDAAMANSLRVMLIVTGLQSRDGNSAVTTQTEFVPIQDLNPEEILTREIPSQEAAAEVRLELPPQVAAVEKQAELQANGGKDAAAPAEGKKPVFNKIFEEETQADLEILHQAVNGLQAGDANQIALRDIKNAISALNNSAQLFAFNHITALAETLEEFLTAVMSRKQDLTSRVVELLKDAAVVFQGMVYEDHAAISEARKIAGEVKIILEGGEGELEAGDETPDLSLQEEAPEDTSELELLDQESLESLDAEEKSQNLEDIDNKGKVGEMVNYVKNLLSEDKEEPDE